jgi:hypothetical protein
VDRQTDREIAESLLMDWYRWSAAYRPKLGAPRVAPYCQQSVSSKQYDDPADAIEVPMQQAIGCEMRNREVNARVWRCPGATSYAVALDAVMGVMRKRGLFD